MNLILNKYNDLRDILQMFDIKSHKPQNKIRLFVYNCDSCGESRPYPHEVAKCIDCDTKVSLSGSFWIKAEMLLRSEWADFLKNAKDDTTFFELFDKKVLDWGEMTAEENDFPCTSENKRMFYESQPALADYIVGMIQSRDLFGMIAISEFKKKLKSHKNGSTPTPRARKSRQTAESV